MINLLPAAGFYVGKCAGREQPAGIARFLISPGAYGCCCTAWIGRKYRGAF